MIRNIILLLFGLNITLLSGSDFSQAKVQQDQDYIRVTIYHYSGDRHTHFINSAKVFFNDICIFDQEFTYQQSQNTSGFYIEREGTFNDVSYIIKPGDTVQIVASCNNFGTMNQHFRVESS